jgi:hypothetical protein
MINLLFVFNQQTESTRIFSMSGQFKYSFGPTTPAVEPNKPECMRRTDCSRYKRCLVDVIATDGIITSFQVPLYAAETPHAQGGCDLSTRTYLPTFRRIKVPSSSGSSLNVKMKVETSQNLLIKVV